MRARTDPVRFGIVVYDGVEPIDIGATYGVLSMARRILPGIATSLVAAERGPVILAGGLSVMAECGFDDGAAHDVVIVCGGPGWVEQAADPRMLRFVRETASHGILASVCTGGMILAASGRLDDRRATTRRVAIGSEKEAPLDVLRRRHPRVQAVEERLVDEGAVVTGGGVSLAIDLTLHLIERVYGADAAAETAGIIEYAAARRANADQFGAAARAAGRRIGER
jgi:transcriptional regulator GlxA family with amidase domain